MKIFLLTLFALLPLSLFAEPVSTTNELQKTINYLLEDVGNSDAVMIRNGSEHNGKAAAALLSAFVPAVSPSPLHFLRTPTADRSQSPNPSRI